jgi:hypothetical protein
MSQSPLDRVAAAYRVNSSTAAVAALVVFNLIPLGGVLWLGWDLMLILTLYWIENGIVGVINVPKILMARGTASESDGFRINGRPASSLSRSRAAGFFALHYGGFWIGHGVFVLAFIPVMTGQPAGPDLGALAVGATGLAISHSVSFWTNYVGQREYLAISPGKVMNQPYGRLVVLHLTIIFGAFVSIFLGTPIGSLLVLVILKIALDVVFHLRQHRPAAASAPAPEAA